jgi:hypothetical protein
VSDVEPPVTPDDAESGGGFTSFLNSTPKVIGAITALIGAVSGLLIALDKAGVIGDGEGSATGTTTASEKAIGPFKERNGLDGRVYVVDSTMYVRTKEPGVRVIQLADQDKALQDVGMSTRVRWVSGAKDYGFSLLCRYRNRKNYYLLGVLSNGRYNIARYRNGRLTSLKQGRTSAFVEEDEYDVVVRCVGERPTTLTLEVNGRMVGQVSDPDGLPAGNIGIRAGSDESVVTLGFEGFDLNSL